MSDKMRQAYDVVVIGGGAAGLSGALLLGRSRRSVLVIDAGEPRNAPAAGVHNFLSRDGMSPAALLEVGRSEVRDEAIGILGSGPLAVHQALLFRQWTSDVTLFVHTAPDPTPTEREQLAARGVSVVEGEVAELVVADDRLTGVRLASGRVVPCQAVVVGPRFVARAAVLVSLGLEVTEHPLGVGSYVAADATGLTAVPGVWVAGNVADLTAQVIGAAAAGAMAGAAINADLIAEETRQAESAYREQEQRPAASERVAA